MFVHIRQGIFFSFVMFFNFDEACFNLNFLNLDSN